MESISFHPLIQVTQVDVTKAREFFGLNDLNRIKDSLDAIDEWCLKQEHFIQKKMNRNMLERIFLLSKGSIEGTKKKIDSMFTLRNMMPEMLMKRTIEEFDRFWDCINYVPLPKLHPEDQSRIMVTQFLTEKLEEFNILTYFRYCFMIGEYRLNYDYTVSERYVVDLTNIHVSLLGKLNPFIIKKAEVLCTEGFGTKIKGIHILSAPPFVDKIIFILKQALREKVASRLHVHSSYEDLHKHIPKHMLPKDYGGDEPSLDKLAAQWKDELRSEKAQKMIREADNLATDESKRQSIKFNEDYLGMPGSFRTLNVD